MELITYLKKGLFLLAYLCQINEKSLSLIRVTSRSPLSVTITMTQNVVFLLLINTHPFESHINYALFT